MIGKQRIAKAMASALSTVQDFRGRLVVLDGPAWQHICFGHPEMAPFRAEIMDAIRNPTHHKGRGSGEEWFYLENVGPSRFIKVVVSFADHEGHIRTAFAVRRLKLK